MNDDVCVAVAQGANVVLYKLVADKEHPDLPRSLVQQRCQLQNEAAADAVAASINRDLGRKRCMLVLANPFSGRGRSLEIWNSTVKPLLDSAGISSRFHQTRARNDARSIVSGLAAPVPFSAILCIGGDGLLCEVINGLMDRDDWKHAVQGVQLVPVAAGTGNALAKTLYNSTEPAVAVCHAIKGAAAKHVDAFLALQSPKDAPKWGCMGVSAGILADADLDSERLRWLGSARFIASGTFHVLAGPRVRCKLTAIVPTEQPSPVSASMATGCPFKFRELFSAAIQGSEAVVHIDSPFVVLANTPFISADLNAAPRAHISDGCFDILYSQSSEMSRWGCAWMLVFGFGNGGNHVQDSRIRLLRASAFTLEVLGPSPRIAVDGEAVSSAPVTVLVAPRLLRFSVFN